MTDIEPVIDREAIREFVLHQHDTAMQKAVEAGDFTAEQAALIRRMFESSTALRQMVAIETLAAEAIVKGQVH